MRAKAYFDGACNPNPGTMGLGVVILADDKVEELSVEAGKGTSNEAEWQALILALKTSLNLGVTDLTVHGDSRLVINQAQGKWKVKADNLKSYKSEVDELVGGFQSLSFKWVPREQNTKADKLSGMPIRLAGGNRWRRGK